MPLAAFPKCFLDDLVRRSMAVESWIDQAAAMLPIDGLELYWGFLPHDDPDALHRLRKRMEARGLIMPLLCCSPDFTQPDGSKWREEVERQKQAIEVTAALGGSLCRVLSGQRRPEVSRAEGIRLSRDAITQLLPYAERSGVTLVLENHYKDGYWQFPEFAQKMDLFLELLNALPVSPALGVNYDPSNALIAGDDPLILLEAVKHRVVSMHASDRFFEGGTLDDLRRLDADGQAGYAPFLRHGVIGQGLNDYDRIFGILKGVGFRGWISIEDGDDPAVGIEHLRLSAEFLRGQMARFGLP